MQLLAGQFADEYDVKQAYQIVLEDFVGKLPGVAWKGK